MLFCAAFARKRSEQAADDAVFVHVDALGRGLFGEGPGIVMILPITTTTKPAPAERRSSRTVIVKPEGAASSEASSEKLYCVLAMHTGQAAKAARVQLRKLLFCGGGKHHVRRAVYVFAYRADLVRQRARRPDR